MRQADYDAVQAEIIRLLHDQDEREASKDRAMACVLLIFLIVVLGGIFWLF